MNPSIPSETIQIQVEQSIVWELILGIAGYSHGNLRHTFEMDEEWSIDAKEMPVTLQQALHEIEETNFWYGLILLQNKMSSKNVQEFKKLLSDFSSVDLYDCLLPYHNRHSEGLKNRISVDCTNDQLWNEYINLFSGHEYLEGYVKSLNVVPQSDLTKLMVHVLSEWEKWMSKKDNWNKWLKALQFEEKQNRKINKEEPISEIERVTDGVEYSPEPSILFVKLIPHVSYRPWVLTIRTANTKLFFYPLKESFLTAPGMPSKELIRGHKALGDELRLRLLFHLQEKPLSLQELSVQFNVSKTTLHHQLTLLKSATFIRVNKGIYSVNTEKLKTFSNQLMHYLSDSP